MKKKLILIQFLGLLNLSFANAQFTKPNLEKYWRYKERFEKEFIVLPKSQSAGADGAGISYPGKIMRLTSDNKKSLMDFTDANSNLSHYLSMLSTEYRLLKNNGSNYDQTLQQLYYAFMTIERLDRMSESYFRPSSAVDPSDVNGWMIRDDVNTEFWVDNCTNFGLPGTGTTSFISGYNGGGYYFKESISQDNVYHLLEGLALVNEIVDAEYVDVAKYPVTTGGITTIKYGRTIDFAAWAKDITTRLIRMMQQTDPIYILAEDNDIYDCKFEKPTWWQWAVNPGWSTLAQASYSIICEGFKSQWYIKNPVTNELAYQGSGRDWDTWAFYSYGLVQAGEKITGANFDFNKSSGELQKQIFNSWLDGNMTTSLETVTDAITFPVFDFITTSFIGLPPLPDPIKNDIVRKIATPIVGKDPYKVKTLATIGGINGESTFWKLRSQERENYSHFMLMYILLHGAPANYNPASSEYQADKEYFEKLLAAAPCKGPRNFKMTVDDNDYNIEWSSGSRLVWPENRINQTDPLKKEEYNGLDYMFLHNLYCLVYQSDFRKLTVNLVSDIANATKSEIGVDLVAANKIIGTSIVNDKASNSIRLVPGFQASSGTQFSAKIISSAINYSGSSQNNICSFTYSGRVATSTSSEETSLTRTGLNNKNILTIVPNPNHGVFDIMINYPDSNDGDDVVNVVLIQSLTGQIVYRDEFIGNHLNLDITRFNVKGMFVVSVKSRGKVYQGKIIIE